MDGEHFDSLTRFVGTTSSRRAFGVAVSGIAASLLHLGTPSTTEARRHKKHRCLHIQEHCFEGKCCAGLTCHAVSPVGKYQGLHCCKLVGESCKEDKDCCDDGCGCSSGTCRPC